MSRYAQPCETEVMMFTSNHLSALMVAQERGRRLRAEAAAERLRGSRRTRHALVMSLRRAADLLDSASLSPRPALR
jgi:hypothetical protein